MFEEHLFKVKGNYYCSKTYPKKHGKAFWNSIDDSRKYFAEETAWISPFETGENQVQNSV